MMLSGSNIGEGPKMSTLVALEHVWDKDENGDDAVLRYARGDRVTEADVKPLKNDGVRLAEEESPEWHEEFNPEAARRAVSHRAEPGDEGYVRVSPEDYQALLDRIDSLEAKADDPTVSAEDHAAVLAVLADHEEALAEANAAVEKANAEVAEARAALEETPAKDGDPADQTKETDVKPETKDKRGPKDKPKDAPKDGDK